MKKKITKCHPSSMLARWPAMYFPRQLDKGLVNYSNQSQNQWKFSHLFISLYQFIVHNTYHSQAFFLCICFFFLSCSSFVIVGRSITKEKERHGEKKKHESVWLKQIFHLMMSEKYTILWENIPFTRYSIVISLQH